MRLSNNELPVLNSFSRLDLMHFLEDFENCLREQLIHSSIVRLDSYIQRNEQVPMILQLGLCKIQVAGTNSAAIARELLSEKLEKKFK